MNKLLPVLSLFALLCFSATVNAQTIAFYSPDTVCVGSPVNVTNQSTGSNYYWQFCSGTTLGTASFRNLGGFSTKLQTPVFATPIKDSGNYYVFCVNHINSGNSAGNLLRFDYGSSLLNTPAITNLGSLGAMPIQSEQLAIKKDGANWYGIMVGGGTYTVPRIITISFGSSIANNTPTATSFGNIGGMDYPIGLHVFNESGNWYAYVANRLNSTITKISFGGSLANTPTGTNMGNIGSLNAPTTLRFIKQGSKWYAFIPNYGGNTISRLSFGTSLLNTPTGVNLGSYSNVVSQPTDIVLLRTCGELGGYITNKGYNSMLKLHFAGDSATGAITVTNLGNLGTLDFPHSISDPMRFGDSLYSFIPNVDGYTMTLMALPNCTQLGISSSVLTTPPTYSYGTAGTYTITLYMDEGMPTQSVLCKNILVVAPPTAVITRSGSTLSIPGIYKSYQWYKNGVLIPGATAASYNATQAGDYYVIINSGYCSVQSNRITIEPNAIHNVQGATLSIFPNPAKDVLFISTSLKVNAVLRSMDGKKVMEQKTATEMGLGALAPGIYVLTITDESGRALIVEKVVKQQ